MTAYRSVNRWVADFVTAEPQLNAAADRPLSADTDALRCRYAERYDLYCAAADLRVDGDGTPEETAAQIEKEWTT